MRARRLIQFVRQAPGYRVLLALRDLGRGADVRAAAILRLRRPAGLFQPFGTTGVDISASRIAVANAVLPQS